jgi:Right handed beta helix region/FlgD Ig-like domain
MHHLNSFSLFTFALICMFFCGNAGATDVPGGNVSGLWDLGGSPYNLLGSVTVPAGMQLTIEPGVTVVAEGIYDFTAVGVLMAEGTAADSIYFSGDLGWSGIRLEDETNPSLLSYCVIEAAEDGINSINSPVTVSHSRLSGNETAINIFGIGESNPATVLIQHCRITDSQQSGIFIVENSNATVDNCEITRSALDLTARGAIQLSQQSGSGNNPTLSNNWLHHNIWQGITMFDVTGAGNIYATITGNVIQYNYTGIYFLYATGEVRDNDISHNFEDGNANSGAGVMIYGGPSAPVFTGNTLTGNFTAFYIVEGATAHLGDLSNADTTDDGGNFMFDNVDLGDNTWSVYNASAADVKAENNSWDSIVAAEIAATIFDNNDSPASGTVDFDPIMNPAAVEDDPADDDTEFAHHGALSCSPNPFTQATTLSFRLEDAEAGGVSSLSVYDPAGRLVKTLVNERLGGGFHTVTWDGTDAAGEAVAAGAYYYRLSGERQDRTGRLLLVR